MRRDVRANLARIYGFQDQRNDALSDFPVIEAFKLRKGYISSLRSLGLPSIVIYDYMGRLPSAILVKRCMGGGRGVSELFPTYAAATLWSV